MAELLHNDSIGTLVRGVLMDIRDLMREELSLARVEIREQAGKAKLAAASLGAALVALAFGGTFLLVAIAVGIADLLNWPVWTGFLIVALLLSVAGFVMLASGRKKLRTVQPVPEETVRTLKENSEWLKRRLSSANR
jgi:Putative Actinobacterial Holin-X, holin superfamily III